jgi:phosphoglycerol transferase MdoB-like AlkP superfamily enzyme
MKKTASKTLNYKNDLTFQKKEFKYLDDYITHIKYTNKIITETLKNIHTSKRKSVVLLMSDHGFRK